MKRNILLLLVCLKFSCFNAQEIKEQKVKSEVKEVTVFLNSAQVFRQKSVYLQKGLQNIRFINLSPFISKKSIQITLKDTEVQAINFEKNYDQRVDKRPKEIEIENKINSIDKKIEIEKVNLISVREEIEFLKSNKSIRGNQTLSAIALKEAAKYYSTQMRSLRLNELELKNNIQALQKQQNKLNLQLQDFNGAKKFASGEIVVKVNSKTSKKVTIGLNYNVTNVSWYPTYDLHVKNINSPIEIVYKANLKQNSKVDWNNVKLKFSSANPSNSNKAGKIIPYFIDYGTRPPSYSNIDGEVSGSVYDIEGPLPGANVQVKGTTIGTTTDFDGRFTLKIPEDASVLEFSYLGYKKQSKIIGNSYLEVILEEDANSLDEVVVVGYGTTKRSKAQNNKKETYLTDTNTESNVLDTKEKINQTSFNFEVVKPYTIKSSNKDFSIAMKSHSTTANFTYYSIPRIEETAFLVAKISDWEQFNLLEGEANVYFENTFIGSTLLDTRIATKELQISMGKDKNVTIERKKVKDFVSKQFIGSKKEETSNWDILVKNNKNENIQIVVLDQVPISKREEIKITLEKPFEGNLNKETGEVKWSFNLASKANKIIKLKYTVKYPKNRNLYID